MTRVNVPLRYAYRLLNHGPTTLVTTRAGDRTNLVSAQWVMPPATRGGCSTNRASPGAGFENFADDRCMRPHHRAQLAAAVAGSWQTSAGSPRAKLRSERDRFVATIDQRGADQGGTGERGADHRGAGERDAHDRD